MTFTDGTGTTETTPDSAATADARVAARTLCDLMDALGVTRSGLAAWS